MPSVLDAMHTTPFIQIISNKAESSYECCILIFSEPLIIQRHLVIKNHIKFMNIYEIIISQSKMQYN